MRIFLLFVIMSITACSPKGKKEISSEERTEKYFFTQVERIDSIARVLEEFKKSEAGPFSAHKYQMQLAKYGERVKNELLPEIKVTIDSLEKINITPAQKKDYLNYLKLLHEIYQLKCEFSLTPEQEEKLRRLNIAKETLWLKIKGGKYEQSRSH